MHTGWRVHKLASAVLPCAGIRLLAKVSLPPRSVYGALPLQAAKQNLKEEDGEVPAPLPPHAAKEQTSPLEDLVRGGARLTRAAQLLWGQIVRSGDFVVDATCGNGGDTLWLARAVGPSGRVLALDVQEDALESTRNLLDWELPPESWPEVQLLQECHTRLKGHLRDARPKLVCFNLGYLPFGDKALMTKPETTVTALQAAIDVIAPGGALSVISYIGHPGGREEHSAVFKLLEELPSDAWIVSSSRILNRPTAPMLTFAMRH